MKKVVLIATILGCGTAGWADAGTNSTQEKSRPQKICRNVSDETGSRLSHRRVCLTREEWDGLQRHQPRPDSDRGQTRRAGSASD